jgi:hypothetical protein
MALPQQVIDRLSNDTQKTPRWSHGLLLFSAGIFFLIIFIYLGITVGYEPYLNSRISQLQQQMSTVSKSIPANQQSALVNFYSGLFHLQALLKGHVVFTPFFAWLEKSTEANVYYSHVVFSSGNQVAVTVEAKTQADLDQQLAIFESAPEVSHIAVSAIAPLQINNGSWQQANMILFMNGSVFSYNNT